MALEKYRQKRDFKKTTEPKPKATSSTSKGKLIFVVQEHHASRLHYDFRLEMNDVLVSWAIPKGPSEDPAVKRLAVMTEDHPMDYANFEGVIPEGLYGAGTVEIWDTGTYEMIEEAKGKYVFNLSGKKLKGAYCLIQLKSADSKNWLFFKKKE